VPMPLSAATTSPMVLSPKRASGVKIP